MELTFQEFLEKLSEYFKKNINEIRKDLYAAGNGGWPLNAQGYLTRINENLKALTAVSSVEPVIKKKWNERKVHIRRTFFGRKKIN